MNYPTSDYLNEVWGSSGTNVYAVGGNGLIVHYDGNTWSKVDINAINDNDNMRDDFLFNWAEANFPDLFSPSGTPSITASTYYGRVYSQTGAILATESVSGNLYYLGPASGGAIYNLGPMSFWYSAAGGGGSITLTGLTISGGTQVIEGSNLQLTAMASWSDGSSSIVTSSATWSDNSAAVSVNGGLVTAGSVTSGTSATISASYTHGGVTRSDTHTITVKNVAATRTLTGLTITGGTQVNEGGTLQLTATASWSDGSTSDVTSSATWSDISTAVSVNGGLVTAGRVTSDTSATISARFSHGVVTKSDTHTITVKNVAATLTGLTITGGTQVNGGGSLQLTAKATYSDGTSAKVTSSATWSDKSAAVTVNGGLVTAGSVTADTSATISASYTDGGVTKSDTHTITIKNVAATSSTLPDTGQTTCYDESGNVISCVGTGQDGEYSSNPMSFTDNGNGTVTDNVTGLIWQKSDDDVTRTWAEAGTYCSSYSPDGSAWRLPTVRELLSIVDAGRHDPSIDPVFSGAISSDYWSSTSGAYYPDYAWYVNFNYGPVSYLSKTYYLYVRCVR